MSANEPAFQIHDVNFDPTIGEVSIDGLSISLTKAEFGVLHLLARNAGTPFTRQQIIEAVHGADCPSADRAVDVHLAAIRRKLGDRRKLIETVRGVGYRFRSPAAS
jgi:two-component system phosphate regulon response regulator PhoB